MVSGSPKTYVTIANAEENTNIFKPELIVDSFGYDLVAAGAGPDINGRATDKYTYDSELPDGSSFQSTVFVDCADGYTMQWDVAGKNKNGANLERFHGPMRCQTLIRYPHWRCHPNVRPPAKQYGRSQPKLW